jgi:hypothetical protein
MKNVFTDEQVAILADCFGVIMEEVDKRIALGPPGVHHAGTWIAGKTYQRSSLVTHGGSLWIALEDAADKRPGQCDAWRLIVKNGHASLGNGDDRKRSPTAIRHRP